MRLLFLGLSAACLFGSVPAQASDRPFTRAELVAFLKETVPYWADPGYDAACERAAATVAARGIGFSYDGGFDAELHQAGACPPVLAAMRRSRAGATGAAAATGAGRGSVAAAQPRTQVSATQPQAAQAGKARPGRYRIFSYGNVSSPLLLGYIDLKANGTYTVLDRGARATSSGRYSHGNGGVEWNTGIYATAYKRSPFEVRRAGKDHVLKLNRVTVAVHSSDVR